MSARTLDPLPIQQFLRLRPADLALKDCWPSGEMTLRRRLSTPLEPCHWPLQACKQCSRRPSVADVALEARVPPLSVPCAYAAVADCRTLCELHAQGRPRAEFYTFEPQASQAHGNTADAAASPAPCCCSCTYPRNRVLVISEDPLLRSSLLALSLGASEVHTVVMKDSNYASASIVARCLMHRDNIKLFSSLEALEATVFGPCLSKALRASSRTAPTPPGSAYRSRRDSLLAQTAAVGGFSAQRSDSPSKTTSAKEAEVLTAQHLQKKIHSYRLVLIDEDYCGPIVSAFGLPQILEFMLAYTCAVCCQVLPRRWQTLVTPSSFPPAPLSSGASPVVREEERPPHLQDLLFASSGRVLRCDSLRLEDVSLSDRFCVLESFELKTLTMPLVAGGLAPGSFSRGVLPFANAVATDVGGVRGDVGRRQRGSFEGGLQGDRTCACDACCTTQCKGNEASRLCLCFFCAKDRHLEAARQRRAFVRGNAVCGIELAGLCAGLVLRSHILVDEDLSLTPSASLLAFLPEEFPLSTHHVIMVGSVAAAHVAPSGENGSSHTNSQRIFWEKAGCRRAEVVQEGREVRKGADRRKGGTPLGDAEGDRRVESDGRVDAYGPVGQLHLTSGPFRDASASFSSSQEDNEGLLVAPWLNLRLQQPKCHWKFSAICDGMRQLYFSLELSLRDLYETARSCSDVDPTEGSSGES
ncbi:hypothetical protein cyc_01115 [Cyclospora cayetanensis]|uniref:Uncharacterized protein n=1 Tax=Cyclospora cayetanensis TaxID=88456 RepID=A0A1D3CYJ8_9EIME|nr:hypothetical protein cyc_01115 [Cyclospora cayetanensis]